MSVADAAEAARADCLTFWVGDRAEYTDEWVQGYWDSQDAPHRLVLEEAVLQFRPKSAYEFGCHCGPNLARLRRAGVPRLGGCDISAPAIERARLELPDADLSLGFVPRVTRAIADGAYDVVFSCYALAYVGPQILLPTLRELWRLARKGLVIMEPMAWGTDPTLDGNGEYYREWAHDYLFLAPRLDGVGQATIRHLAFPDHRINGILTICKE